MARWYAAAVTAGRSKTAMYVALYRALETAERSRPPLFRDDLAVRFLSRGLRAAVWAARWPAVHRALGRLADREAPGARTSAIARTRLIDDQVRVGVARGARQVVLLGAGYDCRAHRLPELRGCRVFEVDRAPMQAVKLARVPRGAEHVRYVPVDFLREDAFERLEAAGWRADERSVVVWEGVTHYLTREAVLPVLDRVGAIAAGSALVFTYVHRGVIDGSEGFEGGEGILRRVRAMGEPWTLGFLPEEIGPLLAARGMRLREDLGADEYRARLLGEAGRGYAFYRGAVAAVG